MNCFHFKGFSDHEYPAVELDMTNFMGHLSEEYISGKANVRDDDVQTNPKIIYCKTEDSTDLRKISSISGIKLERE